MNPLKKVAWKYLISCLNILFIYVVFVPLLGVIIPKPTVPNDLRAILLPFFLFFGIWGMLVWVTKHKQIQKELDERERLIYNNAKNVSSIIFSGLCIAGLSLGFVFYDLKTPVPFILPVLIGYAFWSIAIFVRALIILIQLKAEQSDE